MRCFPEYLSEFPPPSNIWVCLSEEYHKLPQSLHTSLLQVPRPKAPREHSLLLLCMQYILPIDVSNLYTCCLVQSGTTFVHSHILEELFPSVLHIGQANDVSYALSVWHSYNRTDMAYIHQKP